MKKRLNDPDTKKIHLLLTEEEMRNIPQEDLPLAVLSYNYQSMLAAGITHHTSGHYNHFMWMHKPGKFASQDWIFREVNVSKYLKHHRIKLWYNPNWSNIQKTLIIEKIRYELTAKWYKRTYDILAFIGQIVRRKLINHPNRKICSEHADYLKYVDSNYDLCNPSPKDVHDWFKENTKYKVYGRYITGD